jgi:peptidyl-prolyl cis-trans isomerase A (cyclophilin A)
MRHRLAFAQTLFLVFVLPATVWTAVDGAPVGSLAEQDLDPGWYARIDTSRGRLVARLLPEQAPQAVAQFVALAEGELQRADPLTGEAIEGRYYDGAAIYFAEAGIRFEAGDPRGGGPSMWVSTFEGAGPVNFSGPARLGLKPIAGRGATPYSFFVTASAQPRLNGNHPCFGVVVQGSDVVMRITEVKTHRDGRPIDPIFVRRVRIFTVGDPPPLPEPVSYEAERRELAPRPLPD